MLVNKADLNHARSGAIADFCAERGVPLVGRVPYDTVVTEAMVRGQPVTAYADGAVAAALRSVWARIRELIQLQSGSALPGEEERP
ncbi:MAG: hypothetical protein GX601_05680 [Anaerolineales bacterium]|nr:hypothetical protein [Anaerolineales bacterium]